MVGTCIHISLFLHATVTEWHISRITAPIRGGALDLGWANPTPAQISRWNYLFKWDLSADQDHIECALDFLTVFAGLWPSRIQRSSFSQRFSMNFRTFNRWYLQVNFRYFSAVEGLTTNEKICGLLCFREQGQVVATALKGGRHYFEEKRISVFGLISANAHWDTRKLPAFYGVLALGETNFGQLNHYNLKWRASLEGTIGFQLAVLTSVDVWEIEWTKMLDEIDSSLNFGFSQTLSATEIDKWMFDDKFERSRLYFTILQVLRLFGGCIVTVSNDLRQLDDLFLKRSDFPMRDMKMDELEVLRSNWGLVRETQRKAEQSLSDRISYKITEVESLRDGVCHPKFEDPVLVVRLTSFFAQLFNASSLRETNSSSTMGRYVLIFTVVTVLYLPPTFISVC